MVGGLGFALYLCINTESCENWESKIKFKKKKKGKNI